MEFLPCREAKRFRESLAESAKFDNYCWSRSSCFDVAASPVSDGCGPPLELQRRRVPDRLKLSGERSPVSIALVNVNAWRLLRAPGHFRFPGPVRILLHKGLGNIFTRRYRVAHAQPRTKRSSQWLSGEGTGFWVVRLRWGPQRKSRWALASWHLWANLRALVFSSPPYSSMIFF